ncbi:zinc finger protein 225 [Bactrocera neohumeralis]|uniref:zinc finger protein 225 n=1 Tax=Bactrocera tryoni TaxID=59916 RepID=UPI001A98ACCE|nr:zinc finger protein 225 [Bactrocera tryoni]XP_050331778.1 zinc finger protein 225 [Bactrocera neohumeralis]
MNPKRAKFTTLTSTVKEEVVPVLIHDPNAPDGAQYAYATFTSAEESESAVESLSGTHETIVSTQEVIIDEHGRAVTIQQLVDNHSVEEVETVEENDGTHTILHIVPSSPIPEETGTESGGDGDASLSPTDSMGNRSKTFYCPNCGNCYSAAGSLKLHMRACMKQREEVPPEQRKCEICNKVFNSVSYLKEHMMRHTGEGPRRCTRCYRKFIDEGKWKAHMESHKQQDKLDAEAQALADQHGGKKIVVKEFTCSFCSQNFTVVFEEGQVKRRYACDECREKYSNAEQLKQHKQMLGEKRDFHCERCGRKFVFEGFLQRHLPTCDGTIKRRRDMK